MRRGGMKRFILLGMIVLLTTFMSACGENTSIQKETITNVIIEKDGSVKSTIYEDFSKKYYKVEDLTDMINNTISDFCRKNPDANITLEKCEMMSGNNMIETVIIYDCAQTYSDFNNEVLFFGTVKEAYDAGYDFNRILKSTIDSEKYPDISKKDILNMGENHVLIVEENIRVGCYLKTLYISDGVNVVSKNAVDVNNDNRYGMIILNK